MIRYPRPLRVGDTIAVTAPSNGIHGSTALARLDTVINHMRELGYNIVEGNCLRGNRKGASASAVDRGCELMKFLSDDAISAVIPAAGGDLAIETLPFLDFEYLSTVRPKWMLGFSDISTILLPLTLISGWANAHGTTLIGLPPDQRDEFASFALQAMQTNVGQSIEQRSSIHHQWPDFSKNPVSFTTRETRWKILGKGPDGEASIKGRLIGGCLGRVTWLVGSKYGNVPAFVTRNQNEGAILYIENGGLRATELARALLSIKMNGWFDLLSGMLIGRHSGPDSQLEDDLSFLDVLKNSLEGLDFPVIFDADLGHTLPQITLINGAIANIQVSEGRARISQHFL